MAENLLKINEKEGEIFMLLNDKQAGELIKALCAYQFNNGTPESYIGDDRVGGLFVIIKGEKDNAQLIAEKRKKYMDQYNAKRRETQMSECGEEQRTGKFKIRRKKN